MPADMQKKLYPSMKIVLQQNDEELCTVMQPNAYFADLAGTMHLVRTMPDDQLIAHVRSTQVSTPARHADQICSKQARKAFKPKRLSRRLTQDWHRPQRPLWGG